MKVLLCKFGGLGEKSIEAAMINLGFEVKTIWIKCENYDYDINMLDAFAEKISKTMPDIVFSINFLPIISKVCNVYKIQYYSWVYDCPEMHLYSKAVGNPINHIFVFDKIMFERLKKRFQNNIFYLPLATEPVCDFNNWIKDEELAHYSHDVSFIGSLYNEKKRQYYQLENLPRYERGYVEGLARAQMNVYGYNFIEDSLSDEMIARIKGVLKYEVIDDYEINDKEIIADHYIGMYVTSIERINTLQKAADVHKLSIYTDSDTSMLRNVENCGIADSITMMPKIFNLSKINLNITMRGIKSGIPLRVFDVLGAGGFLLTNYQPELQDHFEIGEDLVVFESMDDLQMKIKYYLENDEERMRIANNGYNKVLNNYTYYKLLKTMFAV